MINCILANINFLYTPSPLNCVSSISHEVTILKYSLINILQESLFITTPLVLLSIHGQKSMPDHFTSWQNSGQCSLFNSYPNNHAKWNQEHSIGIKSIIKIRYMAPYIWVGIRWSYLFGNFINYFYFIFIFIFYDCGCSGQFMRTLTNPLGPRGLWSDTHLNNPERTWTGDHWRANLKPNHWATKSIRLSK